MRHPVSPADGMAEHEERSVRSAVHIAVGFRTGRYGARVFVDREQPPGHEAVTV